MQRSLPIIIAAVVVVGGAVVAYALLEQEGTPRSAPAPVPIAAAPAEVSEDRAEAPATAAAPPAREPREATDPPAGRAEAPAAMEAETAQATAEVEPEVVEAEADVADAAPESVEAEPEMTETEPEVAEAEAPETVSEPANDSVPDATVDDTEAPAETVVAAVAEPGIADGLSTPESASAPAPLPTDTHLAVPPQAPRASAPTVEPGAASPLSPAEVRPRDVEAPPDMTPPSFDIVHISADGHSVFAGRAEPGASISVMDGDEVVGSALADSRGEWVVIPDTPLPAGSRELGIAARGESGSEALSESVVVLHVPESPGNAEAEPSAIDHDPIAVSLPRGDTGIARLMQSGEPGYGIEGAHGLSLDSISYDAVGSFAISGRAQPDNRIAAYLDEHGIGRTRASRAGDWTIMPEETVDPGFYTLRVDQLDDGGSVVSQIQTPFTMVDIGETDVAEGLVVVQPGNSLWRIARRVYGRGTQHTIIFQANRDQIDEANLIYPGQIFLLPTPPDGE